MIIKPNWNLFRTKFHENPQENFEWFCYLLFCQEFDKPHGIFRYKNQSAIETNPVKIEGNVIGWQAKFYEDRLSDHRTELLAMLTTAKRDYPALTDIKVYTNSEWGQGKGGNDPKPKVEIEKKAEELGIAIEWRTASYFENPFVAIDQKIISSYFFSESPLIDLSPKKGWFTYENWANPSENVDEKYIVSDQSVIIDDENQEIAIIDGLNKLRRKLSHEKKAIRLVGLSGVGKTRFVQALFDSRVGQEPLDSSIVCYTDMSREPDPSPLVMAEQLVEIGDRAILLVDNCPPNLHRELVKIIDKENSRISLLTVEYDVRDDVPEETGVFKLEPNSTEVIVKILERRFEHISRVDVQKISEFSGGNARIAIALAATVGRGESVSRLRDEELFKRLFQQRNDSNLSLMRSAEVLSLVYSFESQDTDENSELAFLADLIEKSAIDLYRDIEELRKRNLVQSRSNWKAVMPQAISNRLAKQAIESLPKEYMVRKFLDSDSERLIKSFAHRLSFLHDSVVAVEIAKEWLNRDGYLGAANCNSNEFWMSIFEYLAPVSIEDTLAYIPNLEIEIQLST